MRTFLGWLCAISVATAAPILKEKEEAAPTPQQAKASVKNLRELGIAIHNYHDAVGHFPQDVAKDGKPLLSWRVQLLPYLDNDELTALWKQFKMDEPWDSPNNKKLIDKIPTIYKPVRAKPTDGETYYQMFAWSGGLLRPKGNVNLAAITDGLSNTLMVVEAHSPVVWSKPDDIAYNPKELPKLGRMFDGDTHVVMADGAVRLLKKGIDAEVLRRLIDPQDGLLVDVSKVDAMPMEKGGLVPLPPPPPPVVPVEKK